MRAVIPSRPRPIQTSFLIVVFSLGMGNASAQPPPGFTETKLTASDGDLLDEFGRSVDLDGNTLVVGAWVDDDACPDELLCNSGSAYVFVREGSGWIERAKLTADDAQAGDNFGFSIAIHDDTIVVGARLDDDGGSNAGSAYVFSREGPDWVQEFKLLAGDPGGGDFFGYSVDIDHDTVVIGSWLDNDLGGDSGSAYVFVREGTAWTQQAKLVASDGTRSDRFGAWVAIDGDTIVVGAREADGVETSTGAAYIFVREGAVWTQQAKIVADDGHRDAWFGVSVAIEGDTVVVGADRDNDRGFLSGSAYVFGRSGAVWSQEAKLTLEASSAEDRIGTEVAINEGRILIGAGSDDQAAMDSGSASTFERFAGTWTEQVMFIASDAEQRDLLGASLALEGGIVVLGAWNDDDLATCSGAVYIFEPIPPNRAKPFWRLYQ